MLGSYQGRQLEIKSGKTREFTFELRLEIEKEPASREGVSDRGSNVFQAMGEA